MPTDQCAHATWHYYPRCCAEPRPDDPCTPPLRQCARCCVVEWLTEEQAAVAEAILWGEAADHDC